MKKLLTFLTLLTLSIGVTWAATVTDVLNYEFTGISGTAYSEWSGKAGSASTAVYAGQSGGQYSSIQLRTKNSNSGIITTTSGGKVTEVRVEWNANTSVNRVLNIYGKNTAYTAATDLFSSSDQGTLIGTLTYDGQHEYSTLIITGDYAHLGICSADGAIYLSQIDITWETSGGSTPATHSITGTGAVTGGNVTASATSNIAAGTSITITATPDTGYELSNLTVDGNDVTSSVNSNNQYTFSMPDHDVAVSATFTEQSTPQPSGSNRFERINSTNDLEVGKRYILVYEETPAGMGAINTSGTKYGTSVTGSSNITTTNGVATLPSGSDVKPLTLGGNATNGWTFDLDGELLNYTGSKNTLSTGTDNTTWNIAFSGDNATITNKTNNTRVIKYNSASGQERFACYTSGQQPIQLYKEVSETTSDKLYIIGNSLNGVTGWDMTKGIEMTYISSAGKYSANVYFDGMANNGKDYFQFAKGIPTEGEHIGDWESLTDRIGADSDGNCVVQDEWMDGEHGMKLRGENVQSFEIAPGLYTISVVLGNSWNCYVKKTPVTMTINNNTSGTTYFEDSATATLVSNLTAYEGAKIYYTIDGSDPTNSSTRQEYTAPIPISSNTTVKAIAELNHIKSEVAERTFTMKPKAPTFNPESGYLHETTQVEISCATPNTVIYYTTNGDTPDNTSTLYEGPITVSETTTIKAIAYLGDVYGSVASATYTFTGDIVPGENDFILVTNENQLKAGVEYIIVNQVNKKALSTTQNTANRSAVNVTLSGDNMLATLNDYIQVITLLGDENGWYLYTNATENYPDGGYLYATGSTSRNELKTSEEMEDGAMALISIAANAKATIAFQVPKKDYNNDPIIEPWYLRYNTSSDGLFSCYGGPSTQLDVYLYYRGDVTPPTPTEATLAVIESAQGVKDTKYAIADDYLVAVESRDVTVNNVNYVYVWCKDENNVTNKLEPANENIIDFMKKDSEAQGNRPWDQSNWVVLRFKGDDANSTGLKGHKITDIVGTYVDDINYMIDVESYTKGEAISYTPNVYCVANFNPANWGANGVRQPNAAANAPYYFFMTPKVQEVCEITYAEWNGTAFTVPASSGFAKNTLTLGWEYNVLESGPVSQDVAETYLNDNNVPDENGNLPVYRFRAVVQNNPSKGAVSGENKVYPMNFKGESNIVTAINTIEIGNGQIKSVKYVNVAGMVSDVPFQGVNIVVTEYTDGSRTTSKMLRK